MRQFWLAKKAKKKVSLFPFVDGKTVRFRIVGNGYEGMPEGFDPTSGTVSSAIATCIVCGTKVGANITRKLFQNGEADQRMVAVVSIRPGEKGKRYRIAKNMDMDFFHKAEGYLGERIEKLYSERGINPIPDEPIHTPDNSEYKEEGLYFNFTPVLLYGMKTWGSLFNARQKLALLTFAEKVREIHTIVKSEGREEGYAKAVLSYLAVVLSRHSSYNSSLCWWEPLGERGFNTFGRQALPMVFDYAEQSPFGSLTGNWALQVEISGKILKHLSNDIFVDPAVVTQSSATSLPYENNYFDAIFTDPPYYDNVPYAVLSDYFYVWLKRTIGDMSPEIFSTPTAPRLNEAIAELPLVRGMSKEKASLAIKGIKTKEVFEHMLKRSFQEIRRVLKPEGLAIIVYAHKSPAGWETLINSLLASGLVISGAWPVHTEMQSRLRAHESATLASSIYIVARKIARQSTAFYNDVKAELQDHLNGKLDQLWEEQIGGTDFFIAAIGSAIEVFGKYEKVMDYEGNVIRADRLLLDVQKIATDYAVQQILQDGFSGEISDLTRFYVLWRWEYGEARVHFDDARKLALSCNIDVSKEWGGSGFIRKEKEFIRALGPHDRELRELEGSTELIDVLHTVLLLWEKGKRDDMMNLLQTTGYGKHEAFYRVAQAISETLPNESKEKKLLDGFLAGRSRLRDELGKGDSEQIEMEI